MYGEDLDLCWKLQRTGMRAYYLHDVTIIHHGGGSSRKTRGAMSAVMMRRSVATFLRISQGAAASRRYRVAMCLAAASRLGLLAVLFPVWRATREIDTWWAATVKWWAILRWGLGIARGNV
jgi:GT2 family glycosyltransferase